MSSSRVMSRNSQNASLTSVNSAVVVDERDADGAAVEQLAEPPLALVSRSVADDGLVHVAEQTEDLARGAVARCALNATMRSEYQRYSPSAVRSR